MSEATPTKFYSAQNSNREIAGVRFEAVEIFAGSMIGVFATSDPKLHEALGSDAVKKTGVEEITAADYETMLKKKAVVLTDLRHSNTNTPPATPQAAIKGTGKVVVVDGDKVEHTPEVSAQTTEDVLKLAGVGSEPSASPETPAPKKQKQQRNAVTA